MNLVIHSSTDETLCETLFFHRVEREFQGLGSFVIFVFTLGPWNPWILESLTCEFHFRR
jgi:hypothetical protein